jgi:methylated-DNA-[protein]-cysteine S-methyltransferase
MATPFGVLGVSATEDGVTAIDFLPQGTPLLAPQNSLAAKACSQLEAYLRNPEFVFDLPLKPGGTPFRNRVWDALRRIPAGETRSYGELAGMLHSAPRAVGQACGANPLPIVIPCHRVVAKDGGLGGFMNAAEGSPLAIKRWLLQHEQRAPV